MQLDTGINLSIRFRKFELDFENLGFEQFQHHLVLIVIVIMDLSPYQMIDTL